MRHHGHNLKRYELFCEFCGKRMNKSRRDARYHDSCRVAAWRERKREAEEAAQHVGLTEEEMLSGTTKPAATKKPIESLPAAGKLYEMREFSRFVMFRGSDKRFVVRPMLDELGRWAAAVAVPL